MATQRNTAKAFPNATFTRLLGTGSARTFAPQDANWHCWAVLNVWPTREAAYQAETAELRSLHQWQKISRSSASLVLTPLSINGSWGGANPFAAGPPPPDPHSTIETTESPPKAKKWTGATAAITRARIRPSKWIDFWRSSPPVALELANSPGLLAAMGIGEAPIGLQGTFSLWQTNRDLTAFVQRGYAHRTAINSATAKGWYAEDLFARLGVLAASGEIGSRNLTTLHLPSPQ